MHEKYVPGFIATCATFHQGEQGERGLNGDDGLPGPQVGLSTLYWLKYYIIFTKKWFNICTVYFVLLLRRVPQVTWVKKE